MSGLRLEKVKTVFDGGGDIGPVTFDVPKGKMMALLGESGCGKTTTLRMIAGLAPLVEGSLIFNDTDISDAPMDKRRVGMVFQNFGLFPHMNVRDNISFGLRMQKVAQDKVEKKVNWIMNRTRLQGLELRFASELSGGQKQRVALARTLVMDPDILLLDEPLSNLDANLREEMALFIRELQRDLDITTLFVTHDQNEALMLADQVVVMSEGLVLQQGTPVEVFEKPVSREVADFMGGANLLLGQVIPDNIVHTDIGSLVVPHLKGAVSDEITLMIRPEHLQIDNAEMKRSDQHINLPGKVTSSRYHGGFFGYTVEVGEGVLSIRQDSREEFEVGTLVALSFLPSHIWQIPDTRNSSVKD